MQAMNGAWSVRFDGGALASELPCEISYGKLTPCPDGVRAERETMLRFAFPGDGVRTFDVSLDFSFPEGHGGTAAQPGAMDHESDSRKPHAGIDIECGAFIAGVSYRDSRFIHLIPHGQDMAYSYGEPLAGRCRLAVHSGPDGHSLRLDERPPVHAPNLFPERANAALTVLLPQDAILHDLHGRWADAVPARPAARVRPSFEFHVAVDFHDDLIEADGPWTPETFDRLMAHWAKHGASRIYWIYDGEQRHGFYVNSEMHDLRWPGFTERVRASFAQSPSFIARASQSAHRHGMECYAVIKPMDMICPSMVMVAGDDVPPQLKRVRRIGGWGYWSSDLIAERPELREERFLGGIDPDDARPIGRIRLIKDDARAPAFNAEQIEIWVADQNHNYRRYNGPCRVRSTVETRPVRSYFPTSAGVVTEEAARPQRVITLEGLRIPERFVVLKVGNQCSFGNRLFRLVEAEDEAGSAVPFEYGLTQMPGAGGELVRGVQFCVPRVTPKCTCETDLAFLDNHGGFLALARGKEKYLTSSPFVGYPQVQEYLMGLMEECVQAGVDGVDFRIHNHSRTFEWRAFGFQEPVCRAFLNRHGVDPRTQPFDMADMRRLRGEFYTAFLREARRRLNSLGRKMQIHVQPAYADPRGKLNATNEIHMDYKQWLKEGLADAITLKNESFLVLEQRDIVEAAHRHGVPVFGCVHQSTSLREGQTDAIKRTIVEKAAQRGVPVEELVARTRSSLAEDRRGFYRSLFDRELRESLDGHILYENASMVRARADGSIEPTNPEYLEELARALMLGR